MTATIQCCAAPRSCSTTRDANLWTNGYLPQLDTYIGPETPNPLFITALQKQASDAAFDNDP